MNTDEHGFWKGISMRAAKVVGNSVFSLISMFGCDFRPHPPSLRSYGGTGPGPLPQERENLGGVSAGSLIGEFIQRRERSCRGRQMMSAMFSFKRRGGTLLPLLRSES